MSFAAIFAVAVDFLCLVRSWFEIRAGKYLFVRIFIISLQFLFGALFHFVQNTCNRLHRIFVRMLGSAVSTVQLCLFYLHYLFYFLPQCHHCINVHMHVVSVIQNGGCGSCYIAYRESRRNVWEWQYIRPGRIQGVIQAKLLFPGSDILFINIFSAWLALIAHVTHGPQGALPIRIGFSMFDIRCSLFENFEYLMCDVKKVWYSMLDVRCLTSDVGLPIFDVRGSMIDIQYLSCEVRCCVTWDEMIRRSLHLHKTSVIHICLEEERSNLRIN